MTLHATAGLMILKNIKFIFENYSINDMLKSGVKNILILLIVTVTFSCNKIDTVSNLITDTYGLVDAKKYQEAQRKLLQAEDLLSVESPLKQREEIARLAGVIYCEQNVKDKALESTIQALKYARELNDTALMMTNLHNIAVCGANRDVAMSSLKEAALLAEQSGNDKIMASALQKLAYYYIESKDFDKARSCLDKSEQLSKNNRTQQYEDFFTRCTLYMAEGNPEKALLGYMKMNTDSLNIQGKAMRAKAIFNILYFRKDYRTAIEYLDSLHQYTDSIARMDGRRKVEEIEKSHQESTERNRKHTEFLLWSALSALIIISIVLIVTLKHLRLKRQQMELIDRISVLNSKIACLMPTSSEDMNEENPEELINDGKEDMKSLLSLVEQKFSLSYEIFIKLPQYSILKKLNLIRDFSSENRNEIKTVYDEIIGRFSDCCSDLRKTFPAMTNEDCIFCTMNFIGCSKEVISVAMGASEEALRRRKSRIKQKLPERNPGAPFALESEI